MPNVRHILQAASCLGFLSTSGAALAQQRAATEVILHSFSGPDGAHPLGGVIVVKGVLYGTAYSGGTDLGVVFKIEGGAFSVIHDFKSSEGKFPEAGLTEGGDGMFYGTLSGGGNTGGSKKNDGAVFSMTQAGDVTVLHKFTGPEGAEPVGPVSIDAAGNLIGTTFAGGQGVAGTLYKVAPDGTTTALVDFSTTKCEGGLAPVTFNKAGDIFGTTWMNAQRPVGCVFKYDTHGQFTVLHSFDNGLGGREPRAGVSIDAAGNFYGTNYFRGNTAAGTVYKLAPDGTETVLHNFRCGADGGYPYGSLLMGSGKMLYGTAASCGTGGGGVVFSYDIAKGIYRVLHSFQNTSTDGYLPIGPLSMDAQGNLYGATEYGGPDDLGVVFEIKP